MTAGDHQEIHAEVLAHILTVTAQLTAENVANLAGPDTALEQTLNDTVEALQRAAGMLNQRP